MFGNKNLNDRQRDQRRKDLSRAYRWLGEMVREGESIREVDESTKGAVHLLYGYAGTLVRESAQLPDPSPIGAPGWQ